MDINKWMNIAKGISKDKLQTDSGLKEVIRDLGKKAGKSLSDDDVNKYASMFRKMAKTEDVGSLLGKLQKKGVKSDDIKSIKRRLNK
ncbi:UNVERIFIED_CONTAM: uncharacterized protein YpuA (DUF1002 family) [Brevibacillus sp. OAP136]